MAEFPADSPAPRPRESEQIIIYHRKNGSGTNLSHEFLTQRAKRMSPSQVQPLRIALPNYRQKEHIRGQGLSKRGPPPRAGRRGR